MTVRKFFTPEGQSPFYQDDDFICAKEGRLMFFSGWLVGSIQAGKLNYSGQLGYTADGKTAHYFA